MRVIAPVVTTSETRNLCCRPTMAQDPMREQYKRVHTAAVEQIGFFTNEDPDHGVWPLSAQQRSILQDVTRRIDAGWVRDTLLPFIDTSEERVEPSLRLLDWFVTNYAKSMGTTINGLLIYSSYVDVRKAYQCRHFDPFRRNLKISFVIDDKRHWTTVGQVNFLLWGHTTGVLKYVREHREEIDRNMCETCKETRKLRKRSISGIRRKRTALSKGKFVKCRLILCDTVKDYKGVVVRA